jgi:hypothetical protein
MDAGNDVSDDQVGESVGVCGGGGSWPRTLVHGVFGWGCVETVVGTRTSPA